MIKYYCPQCSQKLGVPDDYAGRRVRCNKCNTPSEVPSPITVTQNLELIEEVPAPNTAPPQTSAAAAKPEYTESGPDPLVLAQARAAWEKKYARTLIQANTKGGSSAHPTFGLDNIPLPLRIPLALATSVIAALLVGALWGWIASVSGWIFGIFSIFTAGAAAYGLTLYTEHRNAGLGIISVVLGIGAIFCGKYMVSQWAVLPELNRLYEQQMTEGRTKFIMPDTMNEYLSDEDQMASIACVSLIGLGKIEESEGRQFIIEMQTGGREPSNLSDAQMENLRELTAAQLKEWSDKQRENAVAQNMAYIKYVIATQSKTGKEMTSKMAFACTFSSWDLIMIPTALFVAFKTGAGRS
jgi:hypothetical protein